MEHIIIVVMSPQKDARAPSQSKHKGRVVRVNVNADAKR